MNWLERRAVLNKVDAALHDIDEIASKSGHDYGLPLHSLAAHDAMRDVMMQLIEDSTP